jgi:serine/threonine-protein kinase
MSQAPDPIKPADSQIAPGTILFGEYEILGQLGRGGMGSVYRARHRSLGSLRAIKVIRPDLTLDSKMEELFIREAHALMEIHHDAVVRCHDLLRDEQRIYLIMELVQGPSLEEILRDGPLSGEEVRQLKSRVASGLAAAHRGGVVHRDISPGNIILPNGRADRAKLIDFGVAAVNTLSGKTLVGDFKGKLAYASPEQFGLFGGKVDARSDIYSFGLVLAEAASGEQIPMGQTFYEALEIRKAVPRMPPRVPAELQSEILPLLEPDPARRSQTADGPLKLAPIQQAPGRQPLSEPVPPVPEPRGWLIPVLYSATAVGVGIGLGFMIWMWKAGLALPGTTLPTPAQQPSQTQPASQRQAAPITPQRAPATQPRVSSPSGTVARAEIIATAERLAAHTWVCGAQNVHAACVRGGYRSDFAPGDRVTGIPYDWGGIDGPDELDTKIARGFAAGSHARHGASACTAGIDCSGFVAYVWGRHGNHDLTTATLSTVADRFHGDPFTALKPGDVLNKPGQHVVLFAGYRPDGGPIVYEANGRAGRVIRNDRSSWSRFRHYQAMQYRGVIDR